MLDDDVEEVETDRMKKLSELKQKLEDYCKELAILGFNSSSYDINLIRRYLFQALIEHQEQPKFTVKKSSRYPCIKSEHLKFMDVLQFMAPGYNLKAFFKAFDTTEQKAWFPYEYLRDPQQLEETQLPPYESFYSTIKSCNVLDEEFQTYQKLLREGKTSAQALKVLALEDVPKPGTENYHWLQQVWRAEHWSTLSDYLQWYNNLDVTPMIEAIEKMNTFYQQKGIDFLHQAISLPGVAMRYCFNSIRDPSIEFHRFNHQNKEIYKMVKESIVGGPSIIFNRYHEVDVTNIRNHPSKPCKSIVGYDANALYLYSIGQPMPTGYPVIRRAEKQFKPEKPYFAGECADWLNWLSHSQGIKIQHGLTTGERRIGKYKVDGYCEATKTIYEFHGCWWHMHGCIDWNKYDDGKHPQRGTTMAEVAECDQERRQWLEGKGYNVVVMHECQWKTQMSGNPAIRDFVQRRRHPCEKYGRLTEGQLINMIKRGVFFGFVECDIKVPEHLRSYFEEMTPIFKNTEVQLEDIGEFMEKFAHDHKISQAPRRLLIGSYFGEKICLATPLVK